VSTARLLDPKRAPVSRRQYAIAQALLIDHPAFEPPNAPVSYAVIAQALGISVNTVKTHIRRLSRRHPELYRQVMARRQAAFADYHAGMAMERRERSRQWGKHRWASRYRAEQACWPWEAFQRDVTRAVDCARAFVAQPGKRPVPLLGPSLR